MSLLENILFINLSHRLDRLNHITQQFGLLGITHAERFNAIQTQSGAIGCSLSHIKCLEMAKTNKYKQIFICEDDITFTNPQLFLENMYQFENSEYCTNWDVLIIGGNNVPPYLQKTDYLIKISNCQTTTGYIVREHYYDVLIQNMKEGVKHLLRNPENKREYAVDMYWKKLQQCDNWYMIIPPTVVQYENYSDIEGRDVNYNHLLTDLDKEWLFRPQRRTIPGLSSPFS
jgi:GR25 family glycosyltransferase involved in LPS biosynthesis